MTAQNQTAPKATNIARFCNSNQFIAQSCHAIANSLNWKVDLVRVNQEAQTIVLSADYQIVHPTDKNRFTALLKQFASVVKLSVDLVWIDNNTDPKNIHTKLTVTVKAAR